MIASNSQKLDWNDRVAKAIVTNEPSQSILEYLDIVLQWLGLVDSSKTRYLDKSISKYGIPVEEARQSAHVLLDYLLFSNSENPYRLLGLNDDAQIETVKRRYRRLIKIYHPDLHADGDLQRLNTKTELINKAYNQIKDGVKSQKHVQSKPYRPSNSRSSQPRPRRSVSSKSFLSYILDRYLSAYKGQPEEVSNLLKKALFSIAGLALLFLVILYLINPAENTVSEKYRSYISSTLKNDVVDEGVMVRDSEEFAVLDEGVDNSHTKESTNQNEPDEFNEKLMQVDIINNSEVKFNEAEEASKIIEPALITGDTKFPTINEIEQTEIQQKVSEKSEPIVENVLENDEAEESNEEKVKEQIIKVENSTENQPLKVAKTPSREKLKKQTKKETLPKQIGQEIQTKQTTVEDRQRELILELASRQKVEKQIKELINQFEDYYRRGDVVSLLSLYLENATENEFKSRNQIYTGYDKFFSSMKNQDINFSLTSITKLSDGEYEAKGRFDGTVEKNTFNKTRFSSNVRILFSNSLGKVKIKSMVY